MLVGATRETQGEAMRFNTTGMSIQTSFWRSFVGACVAVAILFAHATGAAPLDIDNPPVPWPRVEMVPVAVVYDPSAGPNGLGLLTAFSATNDLQAIIPAPPDGPYVSRGTFTLSVYIDPNDPDQVQANASMQLTSDADLGPGVNTQPLFASSQLDQWGWDDSIDWSQGDGRFEFIFAQAPGTYQPLKWGPEGWPIGVAIFLDGIWDSFGNQLSAPDFDSAFSNIDPFEGSPQGRVLVVPEPASLLLIGAART
jgi:hypothetical protein